MLVFPDFSLLLCALFAFPKISFSLFAPPHSRGLTFLLFPLLYICSPICSLLRFICPISFTSLMSTFFFLPHITFLYIATFINFYCPLYLKCSLFTALYIVHSITNVLSPVHRIMTGLYISTVSCILSAVGAGRDAIEITLSPDSTGNRGNVALKKCCFPH